MAPRTVFFSTSRAVSLIVSTCALMPAFTMSLASPCLLMHRPQSTCNHRCMAPRP